MKIVIANSNLKELRVSHFESEVSFDVFPYIANHASKLEVLEIGNVRRDSSELDTGEMLTNLKMKELSLGRYEYQLAILRHFPLKFSIIARLMRTHWK